ncbi:hypothetical protein NLG97_g4183 [Lecanicillium saksenae]|uniref:Uncharacterized protein n=1 Tax=Lecanicillium saksenae TaxID=468837 RepID=A0ACC1QXV8_9HYPO|nr:hypothetical protein NLG97_g4183 [Lecanicillium saksenae]
MLVLYLFALAGPQRLALVLCDKILSFSFSSPGQPYPNLHPRLPVSAPPGQSFACRIINLSHTLGTLSSLSATLHRTTVHTVHMSAASPDASPVTMHCLTQSPGGCDLVLRSEETYSTLQRHASTVFREDARSGMLHLRLSPIADGGRDVTETM